MDVSANDSGARQGNPYGVCRGWVNGEVLATRQCGPPGFPDLSLPSELGCRAELSLGSYS
jgi:hypothetical protein